MSGMIADSGIETTRLAEQTVEQLVPEVEALLQRTAPETVIASAPDTAGVRLTTDIGFPDGIGHGTVVARLFRYRGRIRLDIEVQHNRMFAQGDGAPSERRCFLNDYVASLRLHPGDEELPAEFVRSVLKGVQAAVEGVQRHNRQNPQPWRQIRVAAV